MDLHNSLRLGSEAKDMCSDTDLSLCEGGTI